MTIGFLQVQLRLPGCHSLKEKRSILKRTLNLIRTQHNVSAAEIDGQNAWQDAVLGVVTIYNDRQIVEQVFYQVIRWLETRRDVEVVNYSMQMMH
ncbi:MAG: DUF503 family protein [Candidatus Sumerlaeia bacterium]